VSGQHVNLLHQKTTADDEVLRLKLVDRSHLQHAPPDLTVLDAALIYPTLAIWFGAWHELESMLKHGWLIKSSSNSMNN